MNARAIRFYMYMAPDNQMVCVSSTNMITKTFIMVMCCYVRLCSGGGFAAAVVGGSKMFWMFNAYILQYPTHTQTHTPLLSINWHF